MGLPITRNNVEAAIAVFDILAEKKCTITDARHILSFVSEKLGAAATVPKRDYRAMLKEEMDAALEIEQFGE